MAVSPVNLCADLQAWHSAGLSFLYFPELDAAALLRAPVAAAKTPVKTSVGAEKAAAQPAPQVSAKKPSAPNLEAGKKAAPAAVDRPLPAYWQAARSKLKAAPVVWTYRELGEDLSAGHAGRGKALRELIGSLQLGPGTSAFVPVTVPGGAQDGSEAWCFEALLREAGGRIVVVMGADALELSCFGDVALGAFEERIVQGRMLLRLPSFTELLNSSDLFEATLVFLRNQFSKINII